MSQIMTARDEARAKCIEAMHSAFMAYKKPRGVPTTHERMTAAFNSLNGIVTVNLPEATAQMIEAAVNEEYPSAIFRVMAARGNLTDGPEKKP